MAIQFVVETGDGLENATSYVSVEDMKQHWDNVGYSYVDLADDNIQQLLNRASTLLDNMFRKRYPGVRGSIEQALEWPRINAYYIDGWWIDYNQIPKELKTATSEMVYAILVQEAETQPIIKASGKIISEEVQVDVIKEKRTYASPTVVGVSRDKVLAVYDALSRLISNISNSGGLPIRT